MRTIDWINGSVVIIDQTLLPSEVLMLTLTTYEQLIDAIKRLAVRGAPALGVAGAMGVALIARDPRFTGHDDAAWDAAGQVMGARPTAVNLAWGAQRALDAWPGGADAVVDAALAVRDEELANSLAMGELGADLVAELVGDARVMTICNTGGLAAVERGTALSVVQSLHERRILQAVLPLETRPLLQGSRLTAWELEQLGIPFTLIVDSAGPFLLSRGEANVVIIGADRIAANGDTANKVGSYSLASAAARSGLPFVVVAPESTVDMATATGGDIEIEDRGSDEVIAFRGMAFAPPRSRTINPAFDVTPVELITALVTERRIVRFDRGDTL